MKQVEFMVTEGIAGMWHYHVSYRNKYTRGLCGARTMITSIPLSAWNSTPEDYHLPESWCKECYEEFADKTTKGS